MIWRQRRRERQEDERAAQQDMATDATRHATTSRHDVRTRGRYNQIGRQRRATRNNQLARREDERVAQKDRATDATRHATTSRRDERTRRQRKTIWRQRGHATTSWRNERTRGRRSAVSVNDDDATMLTATLRPSKTRITPTRKRARRKNSMTGGRTAAEGCSHRRRRRRARRGPDSLAVDQGIRRSRGRGECRCENDVV